MRSPNVIAAVVLLAVALAAMSIYGNQTLVQSIGRARLSIDAGQSAGSIALAPITPADNRDAPPGTSSSHYRPRVAPWVSSPKSGPINNPALANFGVIEKGIVYRSAQPTDAGYGWLLSQGFKSVVSLRQEQGDDRNYVLGLGFKNYLWLDIVDETDPSDEQAERFLDFVSDSANWPVLIHCKVGLGRTGTMAALIRYAIDGWTMEEAVAEANIYRGGVPLVQGQLDWLERWAANHPRGCHRPISPTESLPQNPLAALAPANQARY